MSTDYRIGGEIKLKKLLLTIAVLLILSSLVFAGLSDDTLEEVRKLSYKHYGWYKGDLISAGVSFVTNNTIEWTRDFLRMGVEDDKLFVETQDGKWFIKMEKVKGGE